MLPKPQYPISLQTIDDQLLTDKQLSLSLLRIDQINPLISGNKWFKLKHNLIAAKQQGYQTLLSFGGPYSNHLHALAAAGQAADFNTIGIIRGEEHLPLNPTLSDVVAQGMKLYYLNRSTYRNKHKPEVIAHIRAMVAEDFYLVPEGGTNDLAVKGAAEIAALIPDDSSDVCVPCGTGGTIAGIITGLSANIRKPQRHQPRVLGFPALKGGQFLQQTITELLKSNTQINWQLFHNYHFGGFGKINQSLALFIHEFEKKHALELDPIYTAKMMYAIVHLIEQDFFPKGSKIVAVHTGGLQGKRGMEQKIQSLIANAAKDKG